MPALTGVHQQEGGGGAQGARHADARLPCQRAQPRLGNQQGALHAEEEHPPACNTSGRQRRESSRQLGRQAAVAGQFSEAPKQSILTREAASQVPQRQFMDCAGSRHHSTDAQHAPRRARPAGRWSAIALMLLLLRLLPLPRCADGVVQCVPKLEPRHHIPAPPKVAQAAGQEGAVEGRHHPLAAEQGRRQGRRLHPTAGKAVESQGCAQGQQDRCNRHSGTSTNQAANTSKQVQALSWAHSHCSTPTAQGARR